MLIFPLLGLLAGGSLHLLLPKEYESVARLQNQWESDSEFKSRAFFSRSYSPAFPQPFTSSKYLKEVIKNENLTTRWQMNEKEITEILKEKITVEEKEGNGFYSVHFLHSDPNEAQAILDSLTNFHIANRTQQESQRAEKQLEALQAEIEDQREKIRNSENADELQSATGLLEQLLKTHSVEKEGLKIQRIPVTKIEPASLPSKPTTPNLFLYLTIGLLTGSLCSLFLLPTNPTSAEHQQNLILSKNQPDSQ